MTEEITFLKAKIIALENGLRLLITDLDEVQKKFNQTTNPDVDATNELSNSDVEDLPWTPYKSGNGSWIFANLDTPIAMTLGQFIRKRGNNRLELYDYVYKFSGRDQVFISRYPKLSQ